MKRQLSQKDTSQDNEASLLLRQPFKGGHSHKKHWLTLYALLLDKHFPTGKPLHPMALYSGASKAKEDFLPHPQTKLHIAASPTCQGLGLPQVHRFTLFLPPAKHLVNSKTKVTKHEFCFETFSCLLQIT